MKTRFLIFLISISTYCFGQDEPGHWHLGLAGSAFLKLGKSDPFADREGIYGNDLPWLSLVANWHPGSKGARGLWLNLQARLRYENRTFENAAVGGTRGASAILFTEQIKERGLLLYPGVSYQIESPYPRNRFWLFVGGGAALNVPWVFERTLIRQPGTPSFGYPDKQIRRDHPTAALGWYGSLGVRLRLAPSWLLAAEFRYEALRQSTEELIDTPSDYIRTDKFQISRRVLYDNRTFQSQLQLLYEW